MDGIVTVNQIVGSELTFEEFKSKDGMCKDKTVWSRNGTTSKLFTSEGPKIKIICDFLSNNFKVLYCVESNPSAISVQKVNF